MTEVGADFQIGMGTQPGNPSTELAPMLSLLMDNILINPDKVDITLSGSLVAKIASVFVPLIKNTIIPSIVKEIQSTLTSTFSDKINPGLAQKGCQITVPYLADTTFDFAQMNNGP